MQSHPALDHALVQGDYHAGRVRIVRNEEVPQAASDLQLLFPHEAILRTSLGCCHTCLYTSEAPPSFVAERIEEHASLFDHLTGEPRVVGHGETSAVGLGRAAAM